MIVIIISAEDLSCIVNQSILFPIIPTTLNGEIWRIYNLMQLNKTKKENTDKK